MLMGFRIGDTAVLTTGAGDGVVFPIRLDPSTGFSATTTATLNDQAYTAAAEAGLTCPSQEQLLGVMDTNDPCQQLAPAATGTTGAGTVTPGLVLNMTPVSNASPALPATSPVLSALGLGSVNPTLLIAGGALVLLMMMGKRK